MLASDYSAAAHVKSPGQAAAAAGCTINTNNGLHNCLRSSLSRGECSTLALVNDEPLELHHKAGCILC